MDCILFDLPVLNCVELCRWNIDVYTCTFTTVSNSMSNMDCNLFGLPVLNCVVCRVPSLVLFHNSYGNMFPTRAGPSKSLPGRALPGLLGAGVLLDLCCDAEEEEPYLVETPSCLVCTPVPYLPLLFQGVSASDLPTLKSRRHDSDTATQRQRQRQEA